MTIASTSNRIAYTANGVLVTFAYTFKIFFNTDLQVYVNGVLKILTTDYTVSGVGAAGGGNVTFIAPPANGLTIVIIRVEPVTQASALPSNDKFPTVTVEDALDKLTMLAQQLNEVDSRALKLAITSLYANVTVPDPVAAKFMRWKADLTGLENIDIVTSGAISVPVSTAQGGTGITQVPPLMAGRFSVLGGVTPFSGVHITPYNGNQITVNGSLRTIPTGVTSVSGGVQATNFSSCFVNKVAAQVLANNTLYYVYLFWDGSALQIDFSTTGRVLDANGVWVKIGDATCTLIGLVWINGTKTIDGAANKQNAVSWLNKVRIPLAVTITAAGIVNTAYAEPNAANILEWVQFNDDIFAVMISGILTSANASAQVKVAVGINSTTVFSGQEGSYIAPPAGGGFSGNAIAHTAINASGSEGHHIAHALALVSAGNTGAITTGQMYSASPVGS